MGSKSNIEWCHCTWNPWRGCTKVSPGCLHCYAEALVARRIDGPGHWGKDAPRTKASEATFDAPLGWNRKPWVCPVCGHCMTEDESKGYRGCPEGMHVAQHHRRRVFLGSLMDIFDPEVDAKWLARVLDIVRRCPDLVFQMVTKRPELFERRLDAAKAEANHLTHEWIVCWLSRDPAPPNVWVIASVEDQKRADERVPALLKIPAAVRGLSVEPLLERIKFSKVPGLNRMEAVLPDWIIVGGESGPGRRDCGVEAIADVAAQCAAAGVACFVKQDCAAKPGQQGRLPDALWARKEFPA